jgi:Response regulator containing a CheY-like receiver domain and an HTH DNA-binding domain
MLERTPTIGLDVAEDRIEPIRVLIVDDHPVFRDGLRLLVADDSRVEVVGLAAGGAEAITAAGELQPDVVVMDLHMPEINGVEATRTIVGQSPHIGVLVLTMLDDDESVFAAMRAGARGYLLKGAAEAEIVRAIEAVSTGTAVFGPTIAQRVIEYFARPRPSVAVAVFPQLTEREREILDLVAQGENNAAIARRLYLSSKTIRNHVSNIFSKLQVADRAEAIVRARRAGLG